MEKPILSLETSSDTCSVAIHQQGRLHASFEHYEKHAHSRVLTAMVDAVLQSARLQPQNLHAIALSRGPGSYTGLRIGASFAKGMCYACQIPLISIDTLQILAESIPANLLPPQSLLYTLLDAGGGYAYGRILHKKGILHDTHLCHVTPTTLDPYRRKNDVKVYLVGSGADHYATLLESIPNTTLVTHLYPSARNMGTLALQKYEKNDFTDLASFSPCYISRYQYVSSFDNLSEKT